MNANPVIVSGCRLTGRQSVSCYSSPKILVPELAKSCNSQVQSLTTFLIFHLSPWQISPMVIPLHAFSIKARFCIIPGQ